MQKTQMTKFNTHSWHSQEGNLLILVDRIYNQPTASIILNGHKQSVFTLRSKQNRMFVVTVYNIILEFLARSIRKRNNGLWIRKEEIKLSFFFFRWYSSLRRKCQRIYKNSPEINEFNNSVGYQQLTQNGNKNTMLFKITQKIKTQTSV